MEEKVEGQRFEDTLGCVVAADFGGMTFYPSEHKCEVIEVLE